MSHTGGPIVDPLKPYRNIALCDYTVVTDGVYVSKMDISLEQFCEASEVKCLHGRSSQHCSECASLVAAAEILQRERVCPLSHVFRAVFPELTYTSDRAKQKLLKIPLACIRVGNPASGMSELLLMERIGGADYVKIHGLWNANTECAAHTVSNGLSKAQVKQLLNLAQSDRERKTIRYAVYKSSNLTPTGARKVYDFDRMGEQAVCVEACMQQALEIKKAFEEQLSIQLTAAFTHPSSDEEMMVESQLSTETNISDEEMIIFAAKLRESHYNWFQLYEQFEGDGKMSAEDIGVYMNVAYQKLSMVLSENEIKEVQTSKEAFDADQRNTNERSRECHALDGLIVTESDSAGPFDPSDNEAVKRKVAAIKRSVRRRRAKCIAKQDFLGRRKSKNLHTIIHSYPDIGSTIEKFVESCNVGADAWRRTGLLTFDGNVKVEKKCTYKRIQNHLESVYKHKFSYGTVVQLCVARNRRRLSSSRYKGVAQVTSRRARKGFMLKFNPDTHWSNALYRSLNVLQLTDGSNIMFLNRDDAAGFRLDTLTTHHQYSTPVVRGKETLTTFTDYVNRYPSVIQTTSYNYTGTETTPELCAGVVKAQPLFLKCPAQHMADLNMLQEKPELKPAFFGPDGNQKLIECIRVDGASDEGPAHLEVQYWWTERHLLQANVVTLVTTRSSGSSYLNRVELQNGCLTRAHSNLYIPSTLHGSPISTDTGNINNTILCENLSTAIDVYIERCDGAPCGRTNIHLYRGATCQQTKREKLLVFLKSSKKEQHKLKEADPDLYQHFEQVWGVRKRHMVTGLPSQYIFFLRCCYESECCHQLCREKPEEKPRWFPGDPTIDFFPLPVPVPSRPWGSLNCPDCSDSCCGHFLKPDKYLKNVADSSVVMSTPPAQAIKEFLQHLGRQPLETEVRTLAQSVLLSEQDVKFWIAHLEAVSQNRKRGAAKAAANRKKKQSQLYNCGICKKPYIDQTDEVENWVQCDKCDQWCHFDCAGLTEEPKEFLCQKCCM